MGEAGTIKTMLCSFAVCLSLKLNLSMQPIGDAGQGKVWHLLVCPPRSQDLYCDVIMHHPLTTPALSFIDVHTTRVRLGI